MRDPYRFGEFRGLGFTVESTVEFGGFSGLRFRV